MTGIGDVASLLLFVLIGILVMALACSAIGVAAALVHVVHDACYRDWSDHA